MATIDQEKTSKLVSGSDILIECLIDHGVDVVFAYPGGASMPIHQSLTHYRSKLRTILPRHEQGGIFAAEGYARSSGKTGVCVATSGPGATNLMTGLADAKMDSCPLIAITGQVGTAVIGTDAFQETPTVEISRAITKHHYLVTRAEDIARVVKEAFYIASSGRPGPVIIDIPKNIQMTQIVPDYQGEINLPGYHSQYQALPEQLNQVVAAIQRAKKPIIYAGGGLISGNAADELRHFVRQTGIPVATTIMGMGVFPADDPMSLHMLGMHGTVSANLAVNDADLLLALGVRFDDRVTGKVEEFAKHGKIIHIDVDASEINKNKEAHIPIVSDVTYALRELNQLVKKVDCTKWLDQITTWKKTEPLRYDQREDCILPQYAIDVLWQKVSEHNPVISVGVGQHQMWAAQYCRFHQPRSFLSSSGLGAMGFGLPAALGAQAAFPDRLVVDIDGDGSFLMNIQELATAHCEKLPVKVFLLNNQHLGMVVQWEDRFHAGNRAHTYLGPIDRPEAIGQGATHCENPYPNFVQIAESFGLVGRQVREKDDLDDAIEEMLSSESAFVLDVLVPYQEHVLPMIPSGHSVKDIIRE
ncbi:MAG: biosynthetic-type acetolactate synthase large subunit [Planctomycetota bacterium]|nr:biosynthetic-type acetolactate synthase large subunit [Planctomycetota bacterium]